MIPIPASLPHRIATAAMLFSTAVLCSCGESQKELLSRHRSAYDDFRKELAGYAASAPAAPIKPAAPLDPAPVYNDKAKETCNSGILMFEQLSDPTVDLRKAGKLDLILSGGVSTVFAWLGKSEADLSAKATDYLEEDLKRVIALRYIGVVKVDKHVAPVATSPEVFNHGFASGTLWLVDRKTRQVVFADSFQAMTSKTVTAQYKTNENRTAAVQRWLESNLWSNVRAIVLEKFSKGAGGTFK